MNCGGGAGLGVTKESPQIFGNMPRMADCFDQPLAGTRHLDITVPIAVSVTSAISRYPNP